MSDGIWTALATDWGPILAGIGAIFTILSLFFKKVIKPVWTALKQYNDLCEKVDKIFYEITPNEGTSIKDSVSRIENNLLLVNERQKAVLSDAKEALFETDNEGNCVWVNRTYSRTVQRTPSELMGHGWQNAIAQDERDKVVSEWYKAVEEDREFVMNFHFETPDGELIPCRIRSYKMTDSKGEPVGYLGTIFINHDHNSKSIHD